MCGRFVLFTSPSRLAKFVPYILYLDAGSLLEMICADGVY
jgi:hypothetical protein